MDISGEYRIPAPRDAVWNGLNDPEVLRRAIPGCEALDKLSDNQFAGTVTAKVGPVKAKFQGVVTLSDLDPPNGYVLSGEGKGAAAGFAKGSAKVDLIEEGDETILRYTVDAQVGGKLAQVGARLIDGTVKKLSGEFFQSFSNILAEQGATARPAPVSAEAAAAEAAPEVEALAVAEAAPPPRAEPTRPTPATGGIPTAVWVVGVIVVVAVLLGVFAGN